MGQYFLASVGVAEAFSKVNGVRQHFFSAKTLTDSSINISVSAEEVRGGPGAQLLGQFFHTSTFGLTMTDAIFKLEYIAAQVGSVIEQGGYGLVDKTAAKEPAAGQLTLGTDGSVTIADPLYDFEGAGALVWYNLPGQSDYTAAVVDENRTFVIPHAEGTLADAYCVHYYADKAEARKLVVSSEFIPAEFEVLLTTRLFAGDASAPETGKPVGSVTVRIPRFQLNGTLDLSMEMASAATISLEGTALAYDDSCDGAKYAEIVEFVSTSIYAGYTALAADADTLAVGDVPMVYAVGAKKVPMLISNDELTFTPALDENGRIKTTLTKIEMALPDATTIVQDFLQTVASVSEYQGEIRLGDDPFTFANPDLKIKQAGDTYTLTGTIANYTGDLEAWGFEPPTTHIFALKLVVEDAGEDVSIVLKGTNHTKNIGKSAFDGDDFIYLVLDGNTKQYTITCKATADNTERVITIDNKASLGA